MIIIPIIFKFIIGSIFGSFLALTLIRQPRHESILWPRSHCDYCHHQLSAWELIPVVSYVILGGRCSACRHSINPAHLIIEVLTGIIFTLNFDLFWNDLINVGFQLILLLLAYTDFKTMTMPTNLVVALLSTGLISILINQRLNWSSILTISVAYLLVSSANHLKPLIGNGDIDVIFILIIKNGLALTSIVTLTASVMGLTKLTNSKEKLIPFIPYLFIANLIMTSFR